MDFSCILQLENTTQASTNWFTSFRGSAGITHPNGSNGITKYQKRKERGIDKWLHVCTRTLSESFKPLGPSIVSMGEGKRKPWNDSWHDGSQSRTAWAVWYQHFSAWLWTSKVGGGCGGKVGRDLRWFPLTAGCLVSARTAEVTDTSRQRQLTRGNADVWKRSNSGYRSSCLYKIFLSLPSAKHCVMLHVLTHPYE